MVNQKKKSNIFLPSQFPFTLNKLSQDIGVKAARDFAYKNI
jgi:hypothetical protein